tara:strand:- start:802 stop:1710 length:909 start_codon:yes stop_codon:yes gene_type:complete
MNVLAFDVGGTSMKYGLVSDKLEIINKDVVETPKNETDFIKKINSIQETNYKNFEKISIAMPGFINKSESKYLYGTNIKFEIDFKKITNFELENFYLDNDGNVAAYAEYIEKYKDKYSNLLMLTFGTGIGGGIVVDKKIYRGKGSAGELGHILVSDNPDNICNCGKIGCLESIVSAKNWTKRCEELCKVDKDTELSKAFTKLGIGSILFNSSIQLTQIEHEAREKILFYMGRGLVSLFEIFNNEIFILGGSMSDNPYNLLELLEKHLQKNYKFKAREFPQIEICNFKSDSGILGATILALNE